MIVRCSSKNDSIDLLSDQSKSKGYKAPKTLRKRDTLSKKDLSFQGQKRKHKWCDVDSDTPIDFSIKPLPQLKIKPKSGLDINELGSLIWKEQRHTPSSSICEPQKPRINKSSKIVESDHTEHFTESQPLPKSTIFTLTGAKLLNKQVQQHQLPAGLATTIIEWHPFWYSKKKGSGPQRFVFRRADNLRHRVCIVLENYGRRLYSSFTDAQNFWAYYSRFQGKRCFYWINRSFKVPSESSLLHFDLEWYTPLRDPKASEKLDTICTAINCALPSPVRILRENLSRIAPNNLFYNSYHLYALVTLEHNAQGCMKTFVINNIWPRLRDRPDMWCGRKKKPIMDLKIYTMNRPFRVPGSSKYDDYHPLPLPSRQLFTDTRMADRRTPPDLST